MSHSSKSAEDNQRQTQEANEKARQTAEAEKARVQEAIQNARNQQAAVLEGQAKDVQANLQGQHDQAMNQFLQAKAQNEGISRRQAADSVQQSALAQQANIAGLGVQQKNALQGQAAAVRAGGVSEGINTGSQVSATTRGLDNQASGMNYQAGKDVTAAKQYDQDFVGRQVAGALTAAAGVAEAPFSDEKTKTKKEEQDFSFFQKLMRKITPWSFQYKKKYQDWAEGEHDKGSTHIGVMAQDVKKVLPAAVREREVGGSYNEKKGKWEGEEKILTLDVDEIAPFVLAALSPVYEKLEDLEKRLVKLEKTLEKASEK